jgi:hypothetical protein
MIRHFLKYVLYGLFSHFGERLSICEGCEDLYWTENGNVTEDMVVLCPKCWRVCLDDGDAILLEDCEQ